jgi:hypothetical protein
MGAVSDNRGQEEISVLTELEVQRWVDEALENAARATNASWRSLPHWACAPPTKTVGRPATLT